MENKIQGLPRSTGLPWVRQHKIHYPERVESISHYRKISFPDEFRQCLNIMTFNSTNDMCEIDSTLSGFGNLLPVTQGRFSGNRTNPGLSDFNPFRIEGNRRLSPQIRTVTIPFHWICRGTLFLQTTRSAAFMPLGRFYNFCHTRNTDSHG